MLWLEKFVIKLHTKYVEYIKCVENVSFREWFLLDTVLQAPGMNEINVVTFLGCKQVYKVRMIFYT